MRVGWLILGAAGLVAVWVAVAWTTNGASKSVDRAAGESEQIASLIDAVGQLDSRLARTERTALLNRRAAVLARAAPGEEDQEGRASSAPAETSPVWDEDDDNFAAPYPEEREKEYFGMYFRELDQVMGHQGHDPTVTSELSRATAAVLVPEELGKLVSLSCSATICRVEIEQEDPSKRRQFPSRFMQAAASVVGNGTVQIPRDSAKLVGYFSKVGTSLPTPSVSFAAVVEGRAVEEAVN